MDVSNMKRNAKVSSAVRVLLWAALVTNAACIDHSPGGEGIGGAQEAEQCVPELPRPKPEAGHPSGVDSKDAGECDAGRPSTGPGHTGGGGYSGVGDKDAGACDGGHSGTSPGHTGSGNSGTGEKDAGANGSGHAGGGHSGGQPGGGGGGGGHGSPGGGHVGGNTGDCDGGHSARADGSVDAGDDAQIADASAPASFSSAALQVEVRTEACESNLVSNYFRVVNGGTTPIKLSDISIKYWAYDTSSTTLVTHTRDNGFVKGADGGTHGVFGVSASATQFSPACGSGTDDEANWEFTIATDDQEPLMPGAEWTHLLVTTSLASCAHFSPGTKDWFSTCLAPSPDYSTNSHYAVYFQGTLVFTSSGINAPACRAPHGSQLLTSYVLPPTSPVMGAVPSSTQIDLYIGLPLQNASNLAGVVDQASDPTSSTYRQWVTDTDFMQNYAPSASDYNQLVSWAQAQGFQVTTYPNNLGVTVIGTAAQIEEAFYIDLVNAKRPNGSTFYEPDRQPSINLSPLVLVVSGLDNYSLPIRGMTASAPSGTFESSDIRNAYLGVGSTCAPLKGDGQTIGVLRISTTLSTPTSLFIEILLICQPCRLDSYQGRRWPDLPPFKSIHPAKFP